ncbi:hypothetical protein ACWEVD_01255 [Nocardia thailandica]
MTISDPRPAARFRDRAAVPWWLVSVAADSESALAALANGRALDITTGAAWPVLAAEHWHEISFGDAAGTRRWSGICLAWHLLHAHGYAPRLGVRVWVEQRVRVEPRALIVDQGPVPESLAVAVDDVLADAGRSRVDLHWNADEDTWRLTD